MKTTLKILPLLFGVVLFFTQCEKEADLEQTMNAEAFMNLKAGHVVPIVNKAEQELWAGAGQNDTEKGYLVGEVIAEITMDENEELILTVEYKIDEPWRAIEYHLWVGKEIYGDNGIPRNAAPGRFPFTGATNTIVLSDLDIGANDPIYIAAHAVVANDELYADYDEIVLPEEVSFSVSPATNFYLNVVVDIEDGGILAGNNAGWCIDPSLPIGPNAAPPPYLADVYLSIGDLPEYYNIFDFGKINWILNFAAPLVPEGVYSMGDVQTAIWRVLFPGGYSTPNNAPGPDFVEDNVVQILANADSDFIPGCNDRVGVILDTQSKEVNDEVRNLQPLLISIPVPCKGVEETAWAIGQYTFMDADPIIARKWGWFFKMVYEE